MHLVLIRHANRICVIRPRNTTGSACAKLSERAYSAPYKRFS